MSHMGEKEIPKYYDFSYLLKPVLPMAEENEKNILAEMLPSKSDVDDLIIDCSINSFLIQGDTMYEKDVSQAPIVGTEKTIDGTKLHLQKKEGKDLLHYIKSRMVGYPQSSMNYNRLYNFELFLLKQKKSRRAAKMHKTQDK